MPVPVELKLRYQSALLELAPLRASSVETALQAILRVTGRTLNVGRTSYWSLDEDGTSLTCEQLYALSSDTFASGGKLTAAEYPAYFAALRCRRMIAADDALVDPRTTEFAVGYFDVNGIGAMLDVPVWREGRLAGVLCHEHVGGPRPWAVDDQAFAIAIANMVALTLEAVARLRAEERYRLASRATGDVIYEWDLASDVISWAEPLYDVFGHLASTSGSGSWWKEHVHPSDRDRIVTNVQSVLASDATSWAGEYRFLRGDGGVADVFDRAFITRDAAGRALRMTGSMTNVTQRKTLEARLLLADRMASLGTLAAGVAHEINNPLSYVKGNIEHVLDSLRKMSGVDPDLVVALEDACHGAQRVADIVRDLRVLSRVDDGKTLVDVDAAVESAIAMASNEIRHRARLVRSLGSPPRVLANEGRLGQVLLNLLVNAAQAIPDDGAETNEVAVTTGTTADGRIRIEVRDTGRGMTPEVAARMFDPFFTTKAIGEGTGLGLSICHTIVTSLGGEIVVETAAGAGTTFRVLLPAAPAEPAVLGAAPVEVAAMMTPRKRVLVVDDDPGVRTLVRRVLEREHEVVVCDGGAAALDLLERDAAFHAIVCDVMMPNVSGIDVYDVVVRKHPELARRVILLTGGAFTPRTREFLDATSLPALQKPFQASTLRRAVADVV